MPKMVYICHPVGGDVKKNAQLIAKICEQHHTKELIPFAPYMVALQYLDDDDPAERALGTSSNKEFFERKTFDELWVFGDKISAGMKDEIKWCLKQNIPIKCKNPALEAELKKLISAENNSNT